MDNSTLQTQYWVPTGPAGMRVAVYAMGSSGSSSRQSVGHKNGEKPQCVWKGRRHSVGGVDWAQTEGPPPEPRVLN